ncbi:2-phospho-L-lactate guanylyltransferase [Candidatus Viridilinea mediisalina]|uniref:Phosphoenolpyruvate guanylyltransferase n=1 Tax=Candidatus Viridilinea mediisalina TaxID=2024553 RepID=A0A2A6RFW3_9CHLR|nr:2-phospho-L-lactate guanylyltransferase [Candidatus Viridilinea mediisalina]PDW01750.1 2-phospho-L-lactate guanylyltransferase [Candidatus Viridilinea mediisalina]
MNLHAIVPLKRLHQAKSRLAPVLPPESRRELVLEMLERVLHTLQHPAVAAVWLVSAEPSVLALGSTWGALPLFDHTQELNDALTYARTTVWEAGASALLVIPADVPLIIPADVAALATALAQGSDVVLVPDEHGSGTNALGLRRQANDIPFCFGPASAHQHRAEATARGLTPQHLELPTLALDIDLPVNLYAYRTLQRVCYS